MLELRQVTRWSHRHEVPPSYRHYRRAGAHCERRGRIENARHARAAAVLAPAPYSSFGPAHMIEARPGVFISSYGCIQDEGYGRWTYCGQGRG